MSSRMDDFVRHLFELEDFRSLTMRTIREKYEEEVDTELNTEQKEKLKEVVEMIYSEKIKTEENNETSDLSEGSEDNAENKKRKRKQIDTSDDNSGSIGCSSPTKKKRKTEKSKMFGSSSDKGSSDTEMKIKHKIIKKPPKQKLKLKKIKVGKKSNLILQSDKSSDISDDSTVDKESEEMDVADPEKSNEKKTSGQKASKKAETKCRSKNVSKQEEKSRQLKYYEKIARACGVMPVGARYKATFKDCSSEADRLDKLKQILRDAGMTGRISMEEAEKLKLKREAAELGTNNIINSEGRSRRNVFSVYSSHGYSGNNEEPENPTNKFPLASKRIIDSDSD